MSGGFESEAGLVTEFLSQLSGQYRDNPWTVYPETADWDLLLVHRDGFQLGLEAKLSLNAKVIDQALSGQHSYWAKEGPDYRGVLVPAGKVQAHLSRICAAIGIGVIAINPKEAGVRRYFQLPDQESYSQEWPCWLPVQRCEVPDYIPDVSAGHKSPVKLTTWKVKAIKLMILLDRRGAVHRSDMKALKISASRWTDRFNGFLAYTPNGYVKSDATPDLRAQHPVNYAQIEADFDNWNPYLPVPKFEDQPA